MAWKAAFARFISSAQAGRQRSFDLILDMASDIAAINPLGLPDLIRAVLRPLQSERMLAVAERPLHGAPGRVDSEAFFADGQFARYMWQPDRTNLRAVKLLPENYQVRLAEDIVLPTPWHRVNFASAVATIGAKKIEPDMEPWEMCYQGPWAYKPTNHRVTLWLPWRIAFVTGGNHSITAGILAGEGVLNPSEVYDFGYLFDLVRCNGTHYVETATNKSIAAVSDHRRAAAFEIGRLIHARGVEGVG